MLRLHGLEVQTVAEPSTLHAGHLQGARAVIFNNLPAQEVPRAFLEALPFFVTHQGGGLLMIGGRGSFGTGAYFGSPIADLLPVSMELQRKHHKLAVSMAIVLDRSGSMAASAGGRHQDGPGQCRGGAGGGIAGPMDSIAVFAVDTAPHAIIPLSTIGQDHAALAETLRGVTSSGGGIYVDEGLKAGFEELRKSTRGRRHLILFADAADAENPGDYRRLLAEMKAEGISVSVIGLGEETDSDAPLLREIAQLGDGRAFFSRDAGTLPSLFEQETVAIARSAFIEEPTPLAALANWSELAARPLAWPGNDRGFGVEELADRLGLHRSILSRRFHALFGLSPSAYLQRLRVRNALSLLKGSELPVAEIAQRCGWEDANYFSRCIRKATGQSPLHFRRGS